MIASFRNKGLAELWQKGIARKIDKRLHARILRRLDVLDAAKKLEDLNVTGFDFHPLHGFSPTRYTMHINGPWCITFEFEDGQASNIDLEQYR